LNKEKKILGIDFGESYVGIALGFLNKKIALPREHLKRTSDLDLSSKIKNICEKENISKVVLGIPSFGSIRNKIISFEKILKKNLKQEVILWDEDNTTQITESLDYLNANPGKGDKDSTSAMVILQDFLESNQKKLAHSPTNL